MTFNTTLLSCLLSHLEGELQDSHSKKIVFSFPSFPFQRATGTREIARLQFPNVANEFFKLHIPKRYKYRNKLPGSHFKKLQIAWKLPGSQVKNGAMQRGYARFQFQNAANTRETTRLALMQRLQHQSKPGNTMLDLNM